MNWGDETICVELTRNEVEALLATPMYGREPCWEMIAHEASRKLYAALHGETPEGPTEKAVEPAGESLHTTSHTPVRLTS